MSTSLTETPVVLYIGIIAACGTPAIVRKKLLTECQLYIYVLFSIYLFFPKRFRTAKSYFTATEYNSGRTSVCVVYKYVYGIN